MSAAYELIDRLTRGWTLCERETDPAKRDRLERHWLDLLQQREGGLSDRP